MKCRDDVLLAYHDSRAGGAHLGIERTHAAIKAKYYWKGMYNDINNYIKGCDTCQRIKRSYHSHPAPLTNLPIVDTFARWHMDILSLTPTPDGYSSVLLVVDSFSRWCESFPLKSQEASEVAKVLYNEIITRYGAPHELVSDRGQNFMSKLISAICEIFQVTRMFTSSYHPQSNSVCERYNSTIAQTLRAYCNESHSNWPDLLPSVMMAFRMSPATQSTGFSPYHMLFAKDMRIPFDTNMLPKVTLPAQTKQYIQELLAKLTTVKKIATENVEAAQERNKKTYDKKAKEPVFKKFDKVWVSNMKRLKGKSAKLHDKWNGPYYVSHSGPNYTYRLRDCTTNKPQKSMLNANRLKKHIQRDTNKIPRRPKPAIHDPNHDGKGPKVPVPNSQVKENNGNTDEKTDTHDPKPQGKAGNTIPGSSTPTADKSMYAVDRLLRARRNPDGGKSFLVKWVGEYKNSWEPEYNITPDTVAAYYSRYTDKGKRRKRPRRSCFQ